jgi:hypothetical protein
MSDGRAAIRAIASDASWPRRSQLDWSRDVFVERVQQGDSPEAEMSDVAASTSKQNTLAGCAVRFFWMLVGNMALFFLAISIAQHEPLPLSWRDAAFLGVVGALICARFLDISYLDGKTTEDNPATRSDWAKYTIRLLAMTGAVWLAAHGLAAAGWMR